MAVRSKRSRSCCTAPFNSRFWVRSSSFCFAIASSCWVIPFPEMKRANRYAPQTALGIAIRATIARMRLLFFVSPSHSRIDCNITEMRSPTAAALIPAVRTRRQSNILSLYHCCKSLDTRCVRLPDEELSRVRPLRSARSLRLRVKSDHHVGMRTTDGLAGKLP
jgi:hypothetical protein